MILEFQNIKTSPMGFVLTDFAGSQFEVKELLKYGDIKMFFGTDRPSPYIIVKIGKEN